MRSISVRIPDTLDGELRLEALRLGVSKAAVARIALMQYVDAVTGVSAPAHLPKRRKAPTDLATNPKHMRGYGK